MGDKARFLELAGQIFDRGWLTNDGPLVQEFEQRIADHLGVRHCVAVCNGTIALEIAIRAVGMSGEVIVPSYTFVATAHALHWQGVTPVFADIDPATHTLDPDAVRRMITPRTTGIIGVHLWGRPAPVNELQKIADEHDLQLLFDAAHAFGCSYEGQLIGRFGRAEVLSFHATKFFNTFEGGAVVTDDDDLAAAIRLMRNFGFAGYDDVIHPGTNGKMIEVCAAMGLVNLDSIAMTMEQNKAKHAAYTDGFADVPGISIVQFDDDHNFQYVVMVVAPQCAVSRDAIVEHLHGHNVLARKYFWPGSHRMQPYRDLYPHAGLMLPHTEDVAARVVVLPNGSAVALQDIDTIVALVRSRVSVS